MGYLIGAVGFAIVAYLAYGLFVGIAYVVEETSFVYRFLYVVYALVLIFTALGVLRFVLTGDPGAMIGCGLFLLLFYARERAQSRRESK